jgi:GDPmannose 4,6-dehydratase
VREVCEIAFARVGLPWEECVTVDAKLVRPAEVDLLLGDASKAKRVLGWQPRVSFRQLIEAMVDADLERVGPLAPSARQ